MKNRKAWSAIALVSLFLLAALCGCGQEETPDSPPAETSQTGENAGTTGEKAYELQADANGGYTILQEDAVVGGAAWLPYPGAEQVDFAACLEPTAEETDREPLQQVLAALWDQRLGQGAETPDYTASVSNVADLQVSFATDQGSESHYLVASGDAFYDIWFQEGALPSGTERSVIDELLAEVQE